jgi:hypothetical protein
MIPIQPVQSAWSSILHTEADGAGEVIRRTLSPSGGTIGRLHSCTFDLQAWSDAAPAAATMTIRDKLAVDGSNYRTLYEIVFTRGDAIMPQFFDIPLGKRGLRFTTISSYPVTATIPVCLVRDNNVSES